MPSPTSPLGSQFSRALAYAHEKHRLQSRKGNDPRVPYIAHVLAVTSLVLEHGGGEEEAIGALLHDVAEDQGGAEVLQEIRKVFGDGVADIVLGCSDTLETPKPPWRPRKEAYIRHLTGASQSIRLVSLADKVHNATSIVEDFRRLGNAVFDRFSAEADAVLWYYRSLLAVFAGSQGGVPPEPRWLPLVDRLARRLDELDELMAEEGEAARVS